MLAITAIMMTTAVYRVKTATLTSMGKQLAMVGRRQLSITGVRRQMTDAGGKGLANSGNPRNIKQQMKLNSHIIYCNCKLVRKYQIKKIFFNLQF
jgi:hypothetical protein